MPMLPRLRLGEPRNDGVAASPGLSLGLEGPIWVDPPDVVAEAYRDAFDATTSLTVGLEEELLLLDPWTFHPINAIAEVLARLGSDVRFACEFRAAQVELITRPAWTVAEGAHHLANARSVAVDRLDGEVRLASVGTHPLSRGAITITDGERYAGIAAAYPWATWRGVPSGLHVHVAVRGADRALAVFNAARSLLPEIGALAANSPYFEGRDTGLASTRMMLTRDLPRSGTPPHLPRWEDLANLLTWGKHGQTIPDATQLWWDLRPSLRHGTLEFRVADAQTPVADAAAVAAVCQTLAAWLAARYDDGEELPVHDTNRIEENRWRALRDGVRGELADLETGRPVPTRERLSRLLVDVEPFSESLGCRNELLHAWSLIEENGAERQRAFVAQAGLPSLLERLADETEAALGE
jgi:carboxylate-amine ligase